MTLLLALFALGADVGLVAVAWMLSRAVDDLEADVALIAEQVARQIGRTPHRASTRNLGVADER